MEQVSIFCIRRNTQEFQNLVAILVSVANTVVDTVQWRTPYVREGLKTGYHYINASLAKPSDDSTKVIRLKDIRSNEFYYAVIPDTADASAYANAANSLPSSPVAMPAVTMPFEFIAEAACKDVSGNYNYFTYTQALVGNQVYLAYASKNGTLLTAPQDQGFASLAAFLTWAQTNWTAYTVTVTGTQVNLAANDALLGSISVEIRNYFESAAPSAVSAGHHYTLAAVINGVAMPTLVGGDNAALQTLADAANADVNYVQWGRYSVVAGKIRLVAKNSVDTAVITATLI